MGLGLTALLGAAWWAGHQTSNSDPVTFRRLTYRNGIIRSARFAPDGQTYVYGMAEDGQMPELMVDRIDGRCYAYSFVRTLTSDL